MKLLAVLVGDDGTRSGTSISCNLEVGEEMSAEWSSSYPLVKHWRRSHNAFKSEKKKEGA